MNRRKYPLCFLPAISQNALSVTGKPKLSALTMPNYRAAFTECYGFIKLSKVQTWSLFVWPVAKLRTCEDPRDMTPDDCRLQQIIKGPTAAILTESDSPRFISHGASAGIKISRIATITRPCGGRGTAPREQLRLGARWMQRRTNGPDCLSAASFRAVRSASLRALDAVACGAVPLARIRPSISTRTTTALLVTG